MNIPKILHLYWGEGRMSWLQTLTVITFHKQNPDWEIRVYTAIQKLTDRTSYIPDYTGKDYLPSIKELPYIKWIDVDLHEYGIEDRIPNILRSDILRHHFLYNDGGMYSDFDVLWIKPIDYLANIRTVGIVPTEYLGASVCQWNTVSGFHSAGVLLARPKHPLYAATIQECYRIQENTKAGEGFTYQAFGPDIFNNMFPELEETIRKYEDVIGFPYKTFYPYATFSLKELFVETRLYRIDASVVGIHWFNGHPLAKRFINTGMYIPCSMKEIIELIKADKL